MKQPRQYSFENHIHVALPPEARPPVGFRWLGPVVGIVATGLAVAGALYVGALALMTIGDVLMAVAELAASAISIAWHGVGSMMALLWHGAGDALAMAWPLLMMAVWWALIAASVVVAVVGAVNAAWFVLDWRRMRRYEQAQKSHGIAVDWPISAKVNQED